MIDGLQDFEISNDVRHVLVELQARIKAAVDGKPLKDIEGNALQGEFINKLRVKKELR